MGRVRAALGVSQRRARQVLGVHRSLVRYDPAADADGEALVKRLRELALANPRYGYRRVAALPRAEGRTVNVKRVLRLWRAEGLKVPRRQRKRRRLGSSEAGTQRRRAGQRNEVWSYDFVFDQTADGRPLKVLPVVDEYTRECLALVVGRSPAAADVVKALARVVGEREPRNRDSRSSWTKKRGQATSTGGCRGTSAIPDPEPGHVAAGSAGESLRRTGNGVRSRAAGAIFGSHARPSRLAASAVASSFRATAMGTTSDAFPFAFSRWAKSRGGPGTRATAVDRLDPPVQPRDVGLDPLAAGGGPAGPPAPPGRRRGGRRGAGRPRPRSGRGRRRRTSS